MNARWVRIAPGQRATNPELSFRENELYSRDRPCTGVDSTSTGGQYIDPVLFDSPCYRESAPSFDSTPRPHGAPSHK